MTPTLDAALLISSRAGTIIWVGRRLLLLTAFVELGGGVDDALI